MFTRRTSSSLLSYHMRNRYSSERGGASSPWLKPGDSALALVDGKRDQLLWWLTRRFSLERGLLIGAAIFGLGAAIDGVIFVKWLAANLGPLNEVRPAIFATTLISVGAQIIFGSFFLSFLQFRKKVRCRCPAAMPMKMCHTVQRSERFEVGRESGAGEPVEEVDRGASRR